MNTDLHSMMFPHLRSDLCHLFVVAFLLVVATNVFPQITIKQSLELRSPSGIVLSPDGGYVAYVITQADLSSNEYRATLNVAALKDGISRELVAAARITSVQWSPDGKSLTYLAKASGYFQGFSVGVDGSRPVQITRHANGIAAGTDDNYVGKSLSVAPDGKRALFWTRNIALAGKQLDALWENSLLFTPDKSVLDLYKRDVALNKQPGAAPALWVVDLATGNERQVWVAPTPDPRATGLWFDWSPDGKQIAVLYRDRYTEPWVVSRSRFVLLDSDRFRPREVLPKLGAVMFSPAWTEDSRSIVFNSEGEIRTKTDVRYQYEWYRYSLADDSLTRFVPPENPMNAIIAGIKKATRDNVGRCSIDQRRNHAVCVREDATKPSDLAIYDLSTKGETVGVGRPLTRLNPELDNVQFGTVESLEWKREGGSSGTSGIILPVGFTIGKKYPLVVMQYNMYTAGRFSATPTFSYAPQSFAGHGYVVLLQNTPSNEFDYTPGDFKTALARHPEGISLSLRRMLDKLIARGIVDSSRMGIMGWSWGGFYSTYILTHYPDWFQAGAAGEGGSHNPSVYWLNSQVGRELEDAFFGGSPYGEFAERWRTVSPILNVDKLRAPLLLESSAGFIQAVEFQHAVLEHGGQSELVVYPTEEHVLYRPINRYASMERHFDWFNFWLLGEIDPNPAKAEQYSRWKKMKADREQRQKTATAAKSTATKP